MMKRTLSNSFGFILEKEGLQCLEAAEGETALRLAREQRPDLLILGFDVARN